MKTAISSPGKANSKTISIRDFVILLGLEGVEKKQKNTQALVLLYAFAEVGVQKMVADVLEGCPTDELLNKIVHYTQWSPEEWEQALADNRSDWADIYCQNNWLHSNNHYE